MISILVDFLISMLTFFINAGLIWLLCYFLRAIGITTIFGWEVSFSWSLVLIFIIIDALWQIKENFKKD